MTSLNIQRFLPLRKKTSPVPREAPLNPVSGTTSTELRPAPQQDGRGRQEDSIVDLPVEISHPPATPSSQDSSNIPGLVVSIVPPEDSPPSIGPGVDAQFFTASASPGLLTPSGASPPQVIIHGEVPDLSDFVTKYPENAIFEGTYSNVYRGQYQGQDVAIKVLRAVSKELRVMKRKSTREIEVWWTLVHPNILPLFGLAEGPGYGNFGALISPWCDRGNASEYLSKNRGLDAAARLQLWLDVAYGISFLHTHNPPLIHGDLKPVNVLIDNNGVAKICDFGLVRLAQSLQSGFTTTLAHSGTARYLSYELADVDQELSPTISSDVHALGCIGMEFLYEYPPYHHLPSRTLDSKIRKVILMKEPPASRPADIQDHEISQLWNMFERCWNIDIEKRPYASSVCRYLARRSQNLAEALSR